MGDPAVIAKLLGWEKYSFPQDPFDEDGPHFWGWVDKDGEGKARASTPLGWEPHWDPYTSDADALMALREWLQLSPRHYGWFGFGPSQQHGPRHFSAKIGETSWSPEVRARTWHASGEAFRKVITTALERWSDEA